MTNTIIELDRIGVQGFENARRSGTIRDLKTPEYKAKMVDPDTCKHPPSRVYAWRAADGTMCAGCCDCGQVLAGGI